MFYIKNTEGVHFAPLSRFWTKIGRQVQGKTEVGAEPQSGASEQPLRVDLILKKQNSGARFVGWKRWRELCINH
jgi:hypothetical protein